MAELAQPAGERVDRPVIGDPGPLFGGPGQPIDDVLSVEVERVVDVGVAQQLPDRASADLDLGLRHAGRAVTQLRHDFRQVAAGTAGVVGANQAERHHSAAVISASRARAVFSNAKIESDTSSSAPSPMTVRSWP